MEQIEPKSSSQVGEYSIGNDCDAQEVTPFRKWRRHASKLTCHMTYDKYEAFIVCTTVRRECFTVCSPVRLASLSLGTFRFQEQRDPWREIAW